MNIAMFGATGRVGQVILRRALEDGHHVQALVRDLSKVPLAHDNLHLIIGNALDYSFVSQTISGADAVISALGTDGATTLSDSMPFIIQAMKENQIKRIITIGTAGILQARTNPHLYRFQSSESRRKSTRAAEDHLKAYLLLKESGLDWTIVCPTYLPDGESKGNYRVEVDYLPEGGMSISVGDTGDFAYSQIYTADYIGKRVGIAY